MYSSGIGANLVLSLSCHVDGGVGHRSAACLCGSRSPASISICRLSKADASTAACGSVRQRVIATLGRLDLLRKSGRIDGLVSSCARFSENIALLEAHRQGRTRTVRTVRIGPPLVFERLWRELGVPHILKRLLHGRRYEFDVERAVFLTVLHRLFPSGSDRAAEEWRKKYAIDGVQSLELHHLYRAMAWLGEALPDDEQADATPFAPRCTKDLIEEALFDRRRDLFSTVELVFFDTTSIYFEGEGGATLGQFGHSKDHRPDRKQMVVAAILDGEGRPICCELWPGNTTDVTTLIPVIDRLRRRFRIARIVIVADRGMISRQTIEKLQAPDRAVHFILGARLRSVKEISETVLSHPGRYREVRGPRKTSRDPAPLSGQERDHRRPSLRRLLQLRTGQAGPGRPRSHPEIAGRPTQAQPQKADRQQRLPQIREVDRHSVCD